MTQYPLTMYGIRELKPGPRWRAFFDATWPAYRRWYLSEGRAARPGVRTAGAALAHHMPELLPTWGQLSEQTGHDLDAAALLTHWNLPTFLPAGCSQVVTPDPKPSLLRNYDYAPALFEGVSISTDYLQPVIGTSDCLWGLLDGMNGSGLVISLTFGGERTVGEGFGIPLVVRYLLETCQRVDEAVTALRRLPISMSYNLTMLDAEGAVGTAHAGPGRTVEFSEQPCATNHRWRTPLDPAHAARFRSVQRLDHLDDLLDHRASADDIALSMLQKPLYSRKFSQSFGTLFTADYRPAEQSVTYHWPELSWTRTFDSSDATVDVVLADA